MAPYDGRHAGRSAGGVYIIYSYDRSIRLRSNFIRGDNSVYNAVFFEP